jgi:peptidoglycan/xylan/chitin deacetylase (PgdA/CDA1 family)
MPEAPPLRWRPAPFVLASAGFHAAALLALAAAPARWPWLAAALFTNHTALAAAGLWPQGRLLGPNFNRLPAAAAARGEVALTFDDGPDPDITPRVLDLLDRRQARATFFLIGRRAETYPDLAAEIVRRGHRVGNHTYTHPVSFSLRVGRSLEREVRAAQDAIARASGERPTDFRAPAGFRNLWLDRLLWRSGLRLVSWTRRGYDTVERRPEHVLRRLLRDLQAGDVLLLHDGSPAYTVRNQPVVLEALPRLLDEIAARGLRAVPFSGGAERG